MSIKLKNGNKGITLIALIITIIVMLILVGVAIDVTIDGKLFSKTDEVVDKTNNKVSQLQNGVDNWTDKLIEVEQSQCEHSYDENGLCTKCEKQCTHNNYVNFVCEECGKEAIVTVGERAEVKSKYTDTSVSPNKIAVIPEGYTVSRIAEEQTIEGGLVIYQIPEGSTVDWTNEEINMQEEYSQFVWIPVENPNEMIMCQSEGTDIDESGTVESDEYMSCNIKIEETTGKAKCTTHNSYNLAGRLYATQRDDNFTKTLTTQKYSTDSGLREPAVLSHTTNGDWVSEDETKGIEQLKNVVGIAGTTDDEIKTNWTTQMQTTFNDMAKSVVENKGFYVGRYETSINGNIAESKSNKIAIVSLNWYAMYKNQQTIGAVSENLGVVPHMIWGSEYDQVMMFVDGKPDGNNVTFDVTTNGSRNSESGSTLTGQNAVDKVGNIYDLEANKYEWTQEANGTYTRFYRNSGSYSTSFRGAYYPWTFSIDISGRLALYIE